MSVSITDPVTLSALNESARKTPDRKLGFFTKPGDAIEEYAKKVFGPNIPMEHRKICPAGNLHGRSNWEIDNALAMTWFTLQNYHNPRHCQIMERDFLRCINRVGVQNTEKWCRVYYEDLMECKSKDKTKKRVEFMRLVREQKNMEPIERIPFNSYKLHN